MSAQQPQGPPGVPPDQNKQVYRNITAKPKEATLKDGVLTIETEYGYTVAFLMKPFFGINTTRPWMKNQQQEMIPEFQTAFNMQPVSVRPIVGKAKPRDEIMEHLKTRNVLPEGIEFDNFTVGFVYATADNPMNHKWMFEFRKNKRIFHAMHFSGVIIDCPFSTTSWHDNIYHGRFQIDKNAYTKVTEDKPGWITIQGNKSKHSSKGDVAMIPEGCIDIRFRFNVKTDYWYADFLDSKGGTISKPLQMHDILGEGVIVKGDIDWDTNPTKPKVTMHCDPKEIKNLMMMAETLVIKG